MLYLPKFTDMAISTNPLMMGMKGALNKEVVFRQRNGRTIISAYPDMSNRKLTRKQLKVNKLMVEANRYAKGTIAEEKDRIAAQVRLDVPRNRLYTSLIKEFFKLHYKKDHSSK